MKMSCWPLALQAQSGLETLMPTQNSERPPTPVGLGLYVLRD